MSDAVVADSLNEEIICFTARDSPHMPFDESQQLVYHLFDQKKSSSSQQSALVLWHQMLKDVLREIPPNLSLHKEVLNQCSEDVQMHYQQFFDRNYTPAQGIRSKLIHDVLCTEEIEVIYLYRSVILHLCSVIENETKLSPKDQQSLIVYHAQTMSEEEIIDIQQHTGCFLAIDGFFSASRDGNLVLSMVQQHSFVLFEIHINLIDERFDAKLEDNDVLFNLNCVFRIVSVEYNSEEHFWKIKLLVDDQTIKSIAQLLENERNSQNGLLFFGHLLWNHLGRINQAKIFFRILLESFPPDHRIISSAHQELGDLYHHLGDDSLALNNYEQALDILQKRLPQDDTHIAIVLNQLGRVYQKKADLKQALDFYQRALSIQEIVYLEDHFSKSNTLRDIGLVYRDQEDWCHALEYCTRAFEMRQRLFPKKSHPDLTVCYSDLGHIYERMNELDLALDCYQQVFRFEEQSQPINSSNLITPFHWMINILKKKEQIERAIELCEEKLLVLKNLLGNDYEQHPQIAHLLLSIATIYEDRYPKEADRHYQQALGILEQHRTDAILPSCLSAMTNFYWKCRMFDRALICQLKLLNLRRSILSSNDIDIAYALRGSARLYRVMNKSYEALFHFEQSLSILQTNYGTDHVDVKNIQKEIVDLQDTIKSVSSSAEEDYQYRRSSNAHKELLISSPTEPKSIVFSPTNHNSKSPQTVSKSLTCTLL